MTESCLVLVCWGVIRVRETLHWGPMLLMQGAQDLMHALAREGQELMAQLMYCQQRTVP